MLDEMLPIQLITAKLCGSQSAIETTHVWINILFYSFHFRFVHSLLHMSPPRLHVLFKVGLIIALYIMFVIIILPCSDTFMSKPVGTLDCL